MMTAETIMKFAAAQEKKMPKREMEQSSQRQDHAGNSAKRIARNMTVYSNERQLAAATRKSREVVPADTDDPDLLLQMASQDPT